MIHTDNQFSFEFKDLELKRENIEIILGYKAGEVPSPFKEWIDDVYDEIPKYVDIKGGYVFLDSLTFDKEKYAIVSESCEIYPQKLIFSKMRKARRLAAFVCTAGASVSDWSSAMLRGEDMTKGYIADVVASEIVDAAMDRIQEELEISVNNEGDAITNRYSPGYCGWEVADQHNLFKAFPTNFCNVKLLDSALMHPVKSISGIIGIGPEVKKEEYGCALCDDSACIFRSVHQR